MQKYIVILLTIPHCMFSTITEYLQKAQLSRSQIKWFFEYTDTTDNRVDVFLKHFHPNNVKKHTDLQTFSRICLAKQYATDDFKTAQFFHKGILKGTKCEFLFCCMHSQIFVSTSHEVQTSRRLQYDTSPFYPVTGKIYIYKNHLGQVDVMTFASGIEVLRGDLDDLYKWIKPMCETHVYDEQSLKNMLTRMLELTNEYELRQPSEVLTIRTKRKISDVDTSCTFKQINPYIVNL